jgi:tetratricopeptide (TPR) repeat protein
LHASLMARLDRWGPAAKDAAQTGAAIGREFGFKLLAAVSDLPKPELHEALDRLANSGLLFTRGTPPEATYMFKHALVQDTAYGTLLRSRRQRLHSRIVVTLEVHFAETVKAHPALLAQHCTEAGLTEKAVNYRLIAGQQALDHSAMEEAVAQSRKGLNVLAAMPDGSWNKQTELDLLGTLAAALSATKGFAVDEVDQTLSRARTLAEQLDRPERLVPLIMSQFMFHFVRSEHRLALAQSHRLEQIGERRNDAGVVFLGRSTRGISHFSLGDFAAARTVLQRCVGFADPAVLSMGVKTTDRYAVMLTFLAVTLACLGFIDQAQSRMDEAFSRARRVGHIHTLANVFSQANCLDWLIRLPMVHVQELLTLTSEFPWFMSFGRSFQGWSLITLGQANEGLALVKQALAEHRLAGSAYLTPMHLAFHAEAYAILGQPAKGLNCIAEAQQFVEIKHEGLYEAELHRIRGDLLSATGDRSAAERSYCEAVAIAERQCGKLFQLRASVSLARLWRDQGKHAEARNLLDPIYSWFTEGFDPPDLKDAKALLDELA